MRPMGPGMGPGFGPRFESDCESGCAPQCGPGSGPHRRMHHMHGPGCGPMRGAGARFFERGGIKFAILELVKDKPRHGYDIIKDMEERSGGFYSPSPGVIYPTLQVLEDQDLVTSTTEEGKKTYTITPAGLAYLEEHKERARGHREHWEAHWGSGPRGEGWSAVGDIRDTLADVKRAVRRSAGDTAKLKEIGEVLEEAAAKIRDIIRK